MAASRPPGYIFDSLPQLVANSDTIIEGTVVSATKGELNGPADSDYYMRDVTVQVDDQFLGADVGPQVVVQQDGYNGNIPFQWDEQPWLYPGDRVVYFLMSSNTQSQGEYTIVALPGQMQILPDGMVSTPAVDPVARHVDGQPWTTVRQEIKDAVAKARLSDIQPLPGGPSPG